MRKTREKCDLNDLLSATERHEHENTSPRSTTIDQESRAKAREREMDGKIQSESQNVGEARQFGLFARSSVADGRRVITYSRRTAK